LDAQENVVGPLPTSTYTREHQIKTDHCKNILGRKNFLPRNLPTILDGTLQGMWVPSIAPMQS